MAEDIRLVFSSIFAQGYLRRAKLPHGWLVMESKTGLTFVPFAADGSGWGPNDPLEL